MKKRIMTSLLCLVMLFSFFGCNQSGGEKKQVTGTVKINAETVFLDAEVELNIEKPSAYDAIVAACKEKDVAFTFRDGMFDNFGGKSSTSTDGWILFDHGKTADVGAKSLELEDDFQLEFRYVNYDEVFAE